MKINNRAIILALAGTLAVLVYLGLRFIPTETATPLPVRDGDVGMNTRIIAFGDSLTAGYGLPLGESYPAQLEAHLIKKGYSVKVVNAGVSGETTKGNVERAPFIRKQNPHIVLLGIGGNDALRYLPIEETETNMRRTIEILKGGEEPPVVILLRMQAPLNAGFGYKASFDQLYETLSNDYDLPLVPFYTTEVFLNPAYKLDDGIHFNKEGYAYIVEEYLLPALTLLLTL